MYNYEQANNATPINNKNILEEFLKLICRFILFQYPTIHNRKMKY